MDGEVEFISTMEGKDRSFGELFAPNSFFRDVVALMLQIDHSKLAVRAAEGASALLVLWLRGTDSVCRVLYLLSTCL